jgi:hypothetical protein
MAATTPTLPMNEQKDCPLFRLPPELRNKIYAYTLCQKQPQQKTTTRLPIESPLEVIDLNNALTLRPSNELLATCRYIYAEAHGIFAAEQRAFWADNTFLIDLRDDWGSATTDDDATEPIVEIPNLHTECVNLIPKVILSVKSGSHHDEYHLNSREQFTWRPERSILDGSTSTGFFDLREYFRLHEGFVGVVMVVVDTVRKTCRGRGYGDFVRANKYISSASRYVNIAAAGREVSKLEQHMLEGVQQKKEAVDAERREMRRYVRQATLSALVQHMHDRYNVQLRPRTKAQ